MAASLTAEQKDFIRSEAFMMENSREHTIMEAAWQLGEHPFAIGGGTITLSGEGETFTKGDVHKIFAQRGMAFDGNPRFALPPYKQECFIPIDWITRARARGVEDETTPDPLRNQQPRQSLQHTRGHQLGQQEQLPLLEQGWVILLQK